ncbi:MAG TPA: GNAT family N-acetyltransferase [Allosphingosinicella sp.]|jgi:CelD/BcsL family acetyltransferase involved in cellulose biosynthesis
MHGTTLRIETIEGGDRLRAIADEWRALARAASEPNIFFEPMAILPALDYPGAGRVFAVVAWGADAAGKRQLNGMLLLDRWNRGPFLPTGLETWDYRLRAFGGPLIRAGQERSFWTALLPHLDDIGGASFLRLAQLHTDSPSTRALIEVARDLKRPLYVTRTLERALLRGGVSREDYLRRIPRKLLSEQKRRRKRLEELGPITFAKLRPEEDPAQWIDEFIALEESGWKGRKGVAAASETHVEAFTRHLLAEAHAQGRLDMRRLCLGERTISMLAHIETGRTAISFKIAYDEEFSRYSPGVLLQMEYLEHGLTLDWVDSCSTPGHPMFERIWLDRRPILSLMIPLDRPAARMACAVENAGRSLFARIRAAARTRAPAAEGLRANA